MKKIYFFVITFCFFNGLSAQIINFPDANFKAKLLAASSSNFIAKEVYGSYFKIDANNNGQIEVSEALQVDELHINSSNISSLVGISSFTNLRGLFCNENQLTTLDISALVNLVELSCNHNQLTTLDVSTLVNLSTLDCTYNQFTTLNIPGLNSMKFLYCHHNQITTLNISTLINLETLGCGDNQLTTLDVYGFVNLKQLSCHNNQLTTLNISGMSNLEDLSCSGNQLTNLNLAGLYNLHSLSCGADQVTTIDLSGCLYLWDFYCFNSPLLEKIFIKNGIDEQIYIDGCPNLEYICADDSQLSTIQTQLNTLGFTNCILNSYCSFTPGGAFYSIEGNTKFDSDNNGCSTLDVGASNFKFNVTNGTITGSLISNSSGNYSIPVQGGTHTITPILENPSYFNVSPSTVNVTFPTDATPFIQDFCITPIASHKDLEITLIPLEVARPGFDSKYKLVYKNKGNITQSGSVNLAFDDAVLDVVVSNPVVSSQNTNSLSWNFSNLQPFESREITFTLNVNGPMETPAVNAGAILHYTAIINSLDTDETPKDNEFALNQTVVGSLDPNDKTCLEGDIITPSLIGEYVHYIIRFENTGTYPAQNIVVKDMIDLSKFDISTLIPTSSSHSYITKISEGNKVEFIFENVNLPFDDANNDGYIAFKIKTLPTLVTGDSFDNEANIYFDYNFPVLTNKATSTFKATLDRSDFEFSNYFSVYPIPAHEVLNIATKKDIEIQSISVYDILGQLVIALLNIKDASKIDVSNLRTGNYFLKIKSDKGNSSFKFIKN
jgi:Leucine-rich repeat (LRR) protein